MDTSSSAGVCESTILFSERRTVTVWVGVGGSCGTGFGNTRVGDELIVFSIFSTATGRIRVDGVCWTDKITRFCSGVVGFSKVTTNTFVGGIVKGSFGGAGLETNRRNGYRSRSSSVYSWSWRRIGGKITGTIGAAVGASVCAFSNYITNGISSSWIIQ